MLNVFTGNGDRGVGILMASGVKGYIIVQGAYPFWVGQNKQGLENLQASPVAGTNIEARDGLYINTKPLAADASPSPAPVWLPWNGDVYILNGTGAGDNLTNIVSVQVVPC